MCCTVLELAISYVILNGTHSAGEAGNRLCTRLKSQTGEVAQLTRFECIVKNNIAPQHPVKINIQFRQNRCNWKRNRDNRVSKSRPSNLKLSHCQTLRGTYNLKDRKSTRLNSVTLESRMPSSA